MLPHRLVWLLMLYAIFLALDAVHAQAVEPEAVIRELVRANADKDMATLSRLMAHDMDAVGYTIGGRKYVGWSEFEQDMREEFDSVTRLEIPITDLRVWTKGDIAWFAMELDYIRTKDEKGVNRRTLLPLRETGVLERRADRWVLVSWHESLRTPAKILGDRNESSFMHPTSSGNSALDFSGEWEILEVEDNKTYKATLDRNGNGPYTQHGGRFVATKFADRLLQGTWHQPGNDREGGFEVLLSADGTEAKGIWWYTRVGSRKNIPPREHGGTYHWKRLTPVPGNSDSHPGR